MRPAPGISGSKAAPPLAPSATLVSFDELSSEIKDIALERMSLGLAAFGLAPGDLEPEFEVQLGEAAAKMVIAEYAAAVTPAGPVH